MDRVPHPRGRRDPTGLVDDAFRGGRAGARFVGGGASFDDDVGFVDDRFDFGLGALERAADEFEGRDGRVDAARVFRAPEGRGASGAGHRRLRESGDADTYIDPRVPRIGSSRRSEIRQSAPATGWSWNSWSTARTYPTNRWWILGKSTGGSMVRTGSTKLTCRLGTASRQSASRLEAPQLNRIVGTARDCLGK